MRRPADLRMPLIGAEIFIEPGQLPEEIDTWFQRLKENGMKITRIRMFESYMHRADDSWDFSLFDLAFRAGEKHGIKIYANLFPATDFTDVGGFKFPKSEANLKEIRNYIQHVVGHFKTFTSLYCWVPVNEPGSGTTPDDEFTGASFESWTLAQLKEVYNSQGYTTLNFNREKFLMHHNTWFLKWLTEQILEQQPEAVIHVNNHAIFQHAAEYNFPEWRGFLDSLGGSAHASWHFGYFTRQKYAVAMSANSEILRSGAGPIPWFMTELQGGNNTYSAFNPMCPTPEEIAQWLWITIGSGSKGSIFWCLNPRRSGFEAGEWAMLNFQDKPSDRLIAAAEVIQTIEREPSFFSNAEVVDSKINVVYTRESMWVEKALQIKGTSYEGREPGGVMKSALAYFEALTEMGIQPGFKEIGEVDFSKKDHQGELIILAHQISIPSKYWKPLESFVEHGGRLIVDGLTAFYDENAFTLMGSHFPFEKLFGGAIEEFKFVADLFDFEFEDYIFPAHLWRGTILPGTGITMATFQNEVTALKNFYGKGEVFWVPSLLGLGGRISGNYNALDILLEHVLRPVLRDQLFRFKEQYPGMLLKTLQSGADYITVLVNTSELRQNISLESQLNRSPQLLFANRGGKAGSIGSIQINRDETLVIKW